jgi:tryptophan synthase alpha chain
MTRSMASVGEALGDAIREACSRGEPALAAFLTAGCPSREQFPAVLREVAAVADVVEIGVPFSDPMADGVTIQESSRRALEDGVNLAWILETLRTIELPAPVVLMSYLNPLLSYGLARLAADAAAARVHGFIIPDLPVDESAGAREVFSAQDIALIQLVTPLTLPERRRRIAAESQGFLYAVTRTGTTGGGEHDLARATEYLGGLRRCSPVPVMAGFGIGTADDVRALAGCVDGVIVGSALVEHVSRGGSAARFLKSLRPDGGLK